MMLIFLLIKKEKRIKRIYICNKELAKLFGSLS